MAPPPRRSRGFGRCVLSLLFAFLLPAAFSFAKPVTITVDNVDSALRWSPSVCDALPPNVCRGEWWLSRGPQYSDGTTHTTSGPAFAGGADCSVTLKFRGTGVWWHTSLFPDGATATVVIDNGTPATISTNQTLVQSRVPILQQGGLDPMIDHTLTLTYVSGAFLDVDFFSILGDDTNQVGPIGGTPTSSGPSLGASQTSSTGRPENSLSANTPSTPQLQPGAIAGIAVGAVAGLLLVILGAYIFGRHQRRRHQSAAPLDMGSPAAYPHPASMTQTYGSQLSAQNSQHFQPASFGFRSTDPHHRQATLTPPSSDGGRTSTAPLVTYDAYGRRQEAPIPPMTPGTMGRVVDYVVQHIHDTPPAYR